MLRVQQTNFSKSNILSELTTYICPVKKTGTLIVFIILCINNISLGQAYKLPVLINHFIEHQQRDKKVTFFDFLSMHYWGKDINDNDQEKDMQLPFKDFSNNTTPPFFCPLFKTFTLRPISYSYKNPFEPITETFLPDPGLSSLFRPPIV
jgi:hypothetical protein